MNMFLRFPPLCSLFAAAALLGAYGCGGGSTVVRKASAPSRPAWIDRPPVDAAHVYFVGACSGADTASDGQARAIRDGLAKVSQFIGVSVEAASRQHISEIEEHLAMDIKERSTANVRGFEAVDWYEETMTRQSGKMALEQHDVYVLLRYSRAFAGQERDRQQADRKQQAASALELYREGARQAGQGDPWAAVKSYRESLRILDGLAEGVVFGMHEPKTSRDLERMARQGVQRSSDMMRRVSLRIEVQGPPGCDTVFRSAFLDGLSEKGYALGKQRSSLEIAGKIEMIQGGQALNQTVYSAQGNIEASNKASGESVAVYEVFSRGFHSTGRQAAVNAAQAAGQEAAEALAEKLAKVEADLAGSYP